MKRIIFSIAICMVLQSPVFAWENPHDPSNYGYNANRGGSPYIDKDGDGRINRYDSNDRKPNYQPYQRPNYNNNPWMQNSPYAPKNNPYAPQNNPYSKGYKRY